MIYTSSASGCAPMLGQAKTAAHWRDPMLHEDFQASAYDKHWIIKWLQGSTCFQERKYKEQRSEEIEY